MVPLLLLVASANDDLTKSIQEVSAARRYHFTAQAGNSIVEGDYQKNLPLFLRADRIDFFRQGGRLVYKQGDKWQRTRTGTLSDPLPILGVSAKVQAIRLPHEELGQLEKVMAKVKKTDEQGHTVLTGEFGEAAARELARTEDRDLARGGTARLWLEKGRLTKYEVTITVRGVRGNADVDGVVTKTVAVTDVGTAKVEVPEAAKRALEQ